MEGKRCKLRILPTLLFLCVIASSSSSNIFISAQLEDQSLNFCEIPCVQKVYDHYCGGARCTTGASDYGQIFALCTDTCAAAVIGEVMMLCLTTTAPDRDDWANVQDGVLEEIVSFCSGYEIVVDENVEPLKHKDTDKKLRNTLFDTPKDEKKEEKGGRKSRKTKVDKAEESETQKQRKKQKAAAESDVATSKEKTEKPKEDPKKSKKNKKRADHAEEAADETVIRREIELNTEILGSIGSPEKDEIEESFDDAFDADSSK